MHINIRHFEVNSISSVGSINIGKTVFSNNESRTYTQVEAETVPASETVEPAVEGPEYPGQLLLPPLVTDATGLPLLPAPPLSAGTGIAAPITDPGAGNTISP